LTAFEDAELTRDGFLNGRLHILQPRSGYRAAIDPVLLAAFALTRPGARVLDLGCGAGTASLCLGARVGDLDLHGLEIQTAYATLARRNAAENGIGMVVHEGDLREPPPELRGQSFDLVLMNPPFHSGKSVALPNPGRDVAHREGEAVLADWVAAGLKRLRAGGSLAIIHLAGRLGDILKAMEGPAGAIEIVPVVARTGAAASRILVRGRKGRRSPTKIHFPLTIHDLDHGGEISGRYSQAAERILRCGKALLPDTARNPI
jgi:tRNA1Val (adenine37-N6)-methyltransferase